MEQAKGFWFNVNAELIIYGATEPDAKVTLGGHEIKLRSDGSFSYRFALPDGKYDLPAVAVSADGTDGARGESEIQPRDGISRRCRRASAGPVAQAAAAGKPVIAMDAPQRGALMLVRFVAVALMGMSAVGTGLVLGRMLSHNHAAGGNCSRALLKSIPFVAGVVMLDQGQSHRGMDFGQARRIIIPGSCKVISPLVLHAHLPFVRHPEHEKFLEESWLFEAVTETYIPLIQILEGWRRDGMTRRSRSRFRRRSARCCSIRCCSSVTSGI